MDERDGEAADLRDDIINDSKPLVEGWLAKQTILHSTTNRTPWRNRYFILKRGCIHYYDVIAEDTIHLKDFAVEHENSRLPVKLEGTEKFGYLLTLIFDQPLEGRESSGKDDLASRMLHLAAESEEEKTHWLDWFVNVALGSESEQHAGWLMVRDKRTRMWKNRYFLLKGKTLHQHHRDQKGLFALAGAEVWSRDGFSFSIKAKSGKILNLMADGQDVRDKWMRLIVRVIKHYQHTSDEVHPTIEDYNMIDFTHKVKDWVDKERPRVEKRVQDFLASGASSPPTSSPDGKFRILSIDGGGMRGLLNCILLSRLLAVFPDLFEKVNFWVGTSNGGMLAMAFAFGYSPALCRTILELAGTKVFVKREGYTGALNRAKFSSQALKILCDEVYGKYTLAQCPSFVLLPSLLLDNLSPDPLQRACENRYYHNLPKRHDDRDRRRRTVSFNTLRQRQKLEHERKQREALLSAARAATAPLPPPSSPSLSRHAPSSAAVASSSSSSVLSSFVTPTTTMTSSSSSSTTTTPPENQKKQKQKKKRDEEESDGDGDVDNLEINEASVASTIFPSGPALLGATAPNVPLSQARLSEQQQQQGTAQASSVVTLDDEEGDSPDANGMLSELASDLVMRTIAAPTYFPSHQQHVDGGMFAHDPASSALTLTISPYWLNKRLDEVVLLSFGTGKLNHYYEDESHDWGYVQWLPKLAGVLWDGMIMQSEQICHDLLGNRYFRFNPVLSGEIPLDDPASVPLLVDIALNEDLSSLVAWVRQHFYGGNENGVEQEEPRARAKGTTTTTTASTRNRQLRRRERSSSSSSRSSSHARAQAGPSGPAGGIGAQEQLWPDSSRPSEQQEQEQEQQQQQGGGGGGEGEGDGEEQGHEEAHERDDDDEEEEDEDEEGEGEQEAKDGGEEEEEEDEEDDEDGAARGEGEEKGEEEQLRAQTRRRREAIQVWAQKEREERERRERMERMEREKKERERRDKEERARREQERLERLEREERERHEQEERALREARELELRLAEAERQREEREREARQRREREEQEAIDRRARQMQEIADMERRLRENHHVLQAEQEEHEHEHEEAKKDKGKEKEGTREHGGAAGGRGGGGGGGDVTGQHRRQQQQQQQQEEEEEDQQGQRQAPRQEEEEERQVAEEVKGVAPAFTRAAGSSTMNAEALVTTTPPPRPTDRTRVREEDTSCFFLEERVSLDLLLAPPQASGPPPPPPVSRAPGGHVPASRGGPLLSPPAQGAGTSSPAPLPPTPTSTTTSATRKPAAARAEDLDDLFSFLTGGGGGGAASPSSLSASGSSSSRANTRGGERVPSRTTTNPPSSSSSSAAPSSLDAFFW